MRSHCGLAKELVLGAAVVCGLAACSGGGMSDPISSSNSLSGGNSSGGSSSSSSSGGGTAAGAFAVTNLVSDGAAGFPAAHQDMTHLVNPWGIAFEPNGVVWTANNGTQTSTLYDGTGTAQGLVVNLLNTSNGQFDPTGVVYNGSADFIVSQGAASGAAEFIYDGEGGALAGWSFSTGSTAVTVYDDGAGKAVYKGLAIANTAGGNRLYAADFHNNKIDVFDRAFNKIAVSGGFKDATLPAGYAPFNIQALGGMLYVTYAEQMAPANHDEVDGAGLGLVDVYDYEGNLQQHLVPVGGALNAPWGLALAPAGFGSVGGDLLVGNFGDGRINVYNPSSGSFVGMLAGTNGNPVAIPGLWGISFANGGNTLFFAAGINDEADGLYGRIDVSAVASGGSSSSSGGGGSSSSSGGGSSGGYMY
ncbi:MAG: TIGR03118 family protein [Nevskia sp.]|nr:TIGR03118 family protein [Nevskia sp.]